MELKIQLKTENLLSRINVGIMVKSHEAKHQFWFLGESAGYKTPSCVSRKTISISMSSIDPSTTPTGRPASPSGYNVN